MGWKGPECSTRELAFPGSGLRQQHKSRGLSQPEAQEAVEGSSRPGPTWTPAPGADIHEFICCSNR